jgi:hypothetical protein
MGVWAMFGIGPMELVCLGVPVLVVIVVVAVVSTRSNRPHRDD